MKATMTRRTPATRNAVWLAALVAAILVSSVAGCAHRVALTKPRARALAASIANDYCRGRYSREPFRASDYPVEFAGGRWHWGEFDPAGPAGFSAMVNFDPYGEDRQVEVRFHTDEVTPGRRP